MKISLQLYDMGVRLAIMRNNFLSIKSDNMNSLFASTARGLEELIKLNWKNWAQGVRLFRVGSIFQGDTRLIYQA